MRTRIKITLALSLSFLVVIFLSKQVFLDSTPRISPNFIASVKNIPSLILNTPSLIASLFNKPKPDLYPHSYAEVSLVFDKQFKNLGNGVYAEEVTGVQYYKFSDLEVNWQEITLTKKNGEKVVLRYPAGQPPVQKMLDLIQSQ